MVENLEELVDFSSFEGMEIFDSKNMWYDEIFGCLIHVWYEEFGCYACFSLRDSYLRCFHSEIDR